MFRISLFLLVIVSSPTSSSLRYSIAVAVTVLLYYCIAVLLLNKGHQLAEDEPVVNHLGVRRLGQSLHLADDDGGHLQYGGEVHTVRRWLQLF